MSPIIRKSLSLGLVGLLSISVIQIALPAYDQYQFKQWLAAPVEGGYLALKKIDLYMEEHESFPQISDLKRLKLQTKEFESIAYMLPKTDPNNPEFGELHVVLPNSGIDPRLLNQKIIFIWGSDYTWRCTMTIDAKLRPDNCRDDAPAQPVYAG